MTKSGDNVYLAIDSSLHEGEHLLGVFSTEHHAWWYLVSNCNKETILRGLARVQVYTVDATLER